MWGFNLFEYLKAFFILIYLSKFPLRLRLRANTLTLYHIATRNCWVNLPHVLGHWWRINRRKRKIVINGQFESTHLFYFTVTLTWHNLRVILICLRAVRYPLSQSSFTCVGYKLSVYYWLSFSSIYTSPVSQDMG